MNPCEEVDSLQIKSHKIMCWFGISHVARCLCLPLEHSIVAVQVPHMALQEQQCKQCNMALQAQLLCQLQHGTGGTGVEATHEA